jgi:hypothetical protein
MAFSRSLSTACADMPMIRDVPSLRIVLETPHAFPTIVVRHFEVHQDHVRALGHGQLTTLVAVLRRENFEVAEEVKPSLEHVEVVVVVFDVEHFGHVADSVLLSSDYLFIRSPHRRARAGSAESASSPPDRSDYCVPPTHLYGRRWGIESGPQ